MGKRFDKLKERLTFKYRLIILDEETYEEQFSFKLSELNVYVFGGTAIIVLILLTSLIIAYTPLREYVPGYASTEVKEKAEVLFDSLQTLQKKSFENDAKLMAAMNVLTGKVKTKEYLANLDSLLKANKDSISKHSIFASKEDSAFRVEFEKENRLNSKSNKNTNKGIVLFAPVNGTITKKYNEKNNQYGIDVAVQKGTPIKSVEAGTVIFADWSVDSGFVIIVYHGNNLISVYKYNASLLKMEGEMVRSGEIIAIAGGETKFNSAPRLYFELWYNGYPVDPTQFMNF